MSKRFLTAAAGSLALFIGAANTQAAVLEPLTSFGGDGYLSPGEGPFPATPDSNQRGFAYNPANNHLYVVSRTGSLSVPILHGDTGAQIGTLNTTGITGGTFAANMIRVADDGAIYATNLVTSTNTTTGALKVYRWADETSAPTVVYSGDVGLAAARFGDTLDVRGSGLNTQILLGQGSNAAGATNFAVLSTADGNTFTPQVFNPAGVANGDFRLGIAFGSGNTIYGKQPGQTNLRLVGFDPAAGTATLLGTNTTVPISLTGIDYDPALDVIGGAFTGNTTTAGSHDARLFEERNFTDLVQTSEIDFPTNFANSNGASATAISGGRMYVLITNNGIAAYTIVPEPGVIGLLSLGGITLLARRRR